MWSVAANGIWPHTLTILGITGMAWASSTRRWWLVGVFGGVALLGRLHVAVIVAVLGLLVGWARRDPRIVFRVGVGSAAFVVVLCAWNYWVYGTWSPSAAYETSMFAEYARNKGLELAPNQLGTWFAPDRGLFVWTPVLLVLAPALVRSWRDLPDWSRALVWGGLAYSVLQCLLDDYDGGFGFYGYRLGLEMLACLTPAVAMAAPRAGRLARRLIGPRWPCSCARSRSGPSRDTPTMLRPGNGWLDNVFLTTVADVGRSGGCPRRHAARRLGQPSVGRSTSRAEPSRELPRGTRLVRAGWSVSTSCGCGRKSSSGSGAGSALRRSYASSLGIVMSGTSSWATQDAIGDVR